MTRRADRIAANPAAPAEARAALDAGVMLTPQQVGVLLSVDAKTITRWARAGQLDAVTLPGGHRRYRAETIRALLDGAAT